MRSETRRHPLIAIEGIDGSGKNTQAHLLVEWLQSQRFAAVYRDFPRYENLTGKAVGGHLARKWRALPETLLEDEQSELLNELVFQCLMTVNRHEEIPEVLDLLEKGPVVLDRYWASGFAYGAANGLPPEWLKRVHALLPEPDVCIFVDVPVEESWKRRPERRDRYERQKGMLERVRANYHDLFQQMAPEWAVVSGLGTVDEVQQRLRSALPKFLVR